jgi:very-short-patch-repair endonuclease
MRKIIPYNPKLKSYARQLRRNLTVAEAILWKRIKGRQLDGYDFDRQRPIGEYVIDFYCKDLRLAIEIDGRSHDYRQAEDDKRQSQIEGRGVHVLRFWEQEVKTGSCQVVEKIREWIRKQPTPGPSREGR